MTNQSLTRIFVYGTLRRDPQHEMFHLLAKHARYLGDASVSGRLFDLGDYPGMISPDETARVFGEVYEFPPSRWESAIARLDEYEGCSPQDPPPHEYRRAVVDAHLVTGETLPAWAYLLSRRPAGLREIKSGDYLAWLAGGEPVFTGDG